MKIAVLGIGGVGGYFGGKLAHHYEGDKNVQVIFIARGKHLAAINSRGLKVSTPETSFIAHPSIATENPAGLGDFDILLVCVKTYDMDSAVQSVASNVGRNTIVIPLVNGLEAQEKLAAVFPHAKIFQGCCYLNSFVENPGAVKFRGGFEQILLGFPGTEELSLVEKFFTAAGLNVFTGENIAKEMWEKFIFGSVLSSLGSLKNESFDEIIFNPARVKQAQTMIAELLQVANAKGISFPETFADKLMEKTATFPKGARTSMQLDFVNGKKTEVETFTGYVIKCADELGVKVPEYELVYQELKQAEKGTPNIEH